MAYRDEVGALHARRDALRSEVRDDPTKASELEVVNARIESASPEEQTIFGRARGAHRCRVPWDGMVGDDRARCCGVCAQNVFDLSGLSSAETARLITEREGGLSAGLWRRADGTFLTAECEPSRKKQNRRLAILGVSVAIVVGALGARLAIPSDVPHLRALVDAPDRTPDLPMTPEEFERIASSFEAAREARESSRRSFSCPGTSWSPEE